ncbi:allantoate amidohydrolase [Sandaracinus amylolyticus]|uniref:N-carbamoyl-L-amino acid hydrolase n=1 Tax=Sandaracinus amylolyticus TaxID=927083 RepID=A0A0F6SGW7_9BACT|nr:allantoate amidohydrolase [Sandaracinus amylolyticus]AKF09414.1 N-carbamoyl-L-amino acid hydrolase [Sandaracinus amylolyticus]
MRVDLERRDTENDTPPPDGATTTTRGAGWWHEVAREVLARCDALGAITEQPGIVLRRSLTRAHADANALVASWMREAGLAVRVDALGNVIGRREGPTRDARTLMIGSHLDTVRDAGKYDGPLGVLAGIVIARALRDEALPFALEVVGFSDEEGVRFGRPFLGSRAIAGSFALEDLALRDADGTTLGDAIRAFTAHDGSIEDEIARAAIDPRSVRAFLEIHIEQGPVLESVDAPLGVVTGIAGQTWQTLRLEGRAGHAGTTPLALRRDALAGAAEIALMVEAHAHATPGLVATVGRIDAHPGGHNVIAGSATMQLDVRAVDGAVLDRALDEIHARAESIASRRSLRLAREMRLRQAPVICDATLRELLARSIADAGLPVFSLPSGAGHDARILAAIAPVAMLFVRSPDGLSHHPDERAHEGDVARALEVGCAWVRAIADGDRATARTTEGGSR